MTTYATGQQNRAALLDSQRRVLERIANPRGPIRWRSAAAPCCPPIPSSSG